jgi:hypothetical protein
LVVVQQTDSSKYAQNYIDEFWYKLNGTLNWEELFDRLLLTGIIVNNKNINYDQQSYFINITYAKENEA